MSPRSIKTTRFDRKLLEFTFQHLILGAFCLMLGALGGCSTPSKPSQPVSASHATIDKLNLLAAPIALNLDGIPGGDSIAVKIYATNSREAKPIPIMSGSVDLLAFDGVPGASTNSPQPFKTWTFTASELRRLQFKASIGTGYQITASFIGLKPKSDRLTILARYLTDNGRAIYSSPSTISLTAN